MGNLKFGGYFDKDDAIPSSNTGLNKYAQARLNNTVSRAVAKHANSLFVDGIYFNVWTKTLGGIPCTCSGKQLKGSLSDSVPLRSPDVNANNRQPIKSKNPLDISDSNDNDFSAFVFSTNDQSAVISSFNQTPPDQALDFNTPLDNSLDTLNRNLLLEQLTQPVDDDELARLISGQNTGAVFGGDKTACGICFSTGHVNGYTLQGGQRVILDASFTNPYVLTGGAYVDFNSHPNKFILNGTATVGWTADLSPYVLQWLSFEVNNNLQPARNTIFELFYAGAWQEITLGLLLSLNGANTSAMQLRVRANPASNLGVDDTIEFTHAEISYMLTPPLLGQAPQLPVALNFDVLEPLINTNFELLASLPNLPRESIMQDSRTNLLWKVTQVTAKITSSGQVFGYDVDVRKVNTSEALYRLVLPLNIPTAPQNNLPAS